MNAGRSAETVKEPPKISVLTCSLNSARTIGHTLESFFSQTHARKEILILDGGSTDGTLEVVRSFPADAVTTVSERDAGMYDALNKGLRLYSGEAVGCLNAGDRYHDPAALAHIAQALAGADMVWGDLDFVRDPGSAQVVRRWRGTSHPPGGFRTGWMPPHPTFYVRREVVDRVGAFDLRYSIASDYDWMLRAFELHDFRTLHIGRTLVEMSVGGRSTAGIRSRLTHNLEALRSRRLWLGTGIVDRALVLKPLRKLRQHHLRQPAPGKYGP